MLRVLSFSVGNSDANFLKSISDQFSFVLGLKQDLGPKFFNPIKFARTFIYEKIKISAVYHLLLTKDFYIIYFSINVE